MYTHVQLLNGYQKSLTYKIPSDWNTTNLIGSIITVPLQKRVEHALITNVFERLPSDITYVIREALAQEKFPHDAHYYTYIEQLSAYYAIQPITLYQRIAHFIAAQQEQCVMPEEKRSATADVQLTSEQQAAVDAITPYIHQPAFKPIVVQGVTGSGKTEIYKKAITQAHAVGKSTLLLLPEVSLAVRFTALLQEQLPAIPICGFHCATSAPDKKKLWQRLIDGNPLVIVGVHLPILMPIANLGLLIVDEEHDGGFQEKKYPKINSKEAALLRAQFYKIPIVLGSATPSLQTLYCVEHKKWQVCTLTKRFAGAFPVIKVVKLDGAVERKNFWISRELEQAIAQRLHKKEQVIIFLNRRGFSFFMQCKSCGFIFECPNCSVSLTVHADHSMRCHYCDYRTLCPARCTACKPTQDTLLKKGIGTQQVVTILEKMFPSARIARADLDTTVNKKKWEETVGQFSQGNLDIVVGTQTITKGYHFPGVTLVGLLWADINLALPFYNAAETTLQQIIQVAGRAGRQSPESLVIVQTMKDHPIFAYSNEEKYHQFYQYEIAHRTELQYPPCVRFAEIELRHEYEQEVERVSDQCLQLLLDQNFPGLKILGPAQPPVHKIKNIHIRKIYLKSNSYTLIHQAYRLLIGAKLPVSLFFTPNPLQ